jgi:large subunit ribosomal protein L9
MKIIIIKKSAVGNIGETLDVKSGYGQYLILQNIAVRDDLKERQKIQLETSKKNKVKQKKNIELDNALSRIKKDSNIIISVKANEKGNLYGAVSEQEVIKALENQLGVVLGKLNIKLNTTLKELGKFKAEILINNIKKGINIQIKQSDDNKAN